MTTSTTQGGKENHHFIEEGQDNPPTADTKEVMEQTLMSINLILQELHLKEDKLREIKENFDGLLNSDGSLGRINSSLQRNELVDLECDENPRTSLLRSVGPRKS